MRGRLIFLVSLLLLLTMTQEQVSAQYSRHSLGVRIGNQVAADYKFCFSERSAIDVNFGVVNPFTPQYQFLLLSGAYHYHLKSGSPGVIPYIGAGLSGGVQFGGRSEARRNDVTYFMSADVPLGFEYILRRYPVTFAVEWSPKLQFLSEVRFIAQSISLGIRFNF